MDVRSFMNQDFQCDVLHFVCDCLDYCSLYIDRRRCCRRPMTWIWTAELIAGPVGGHLQRVQPDGGGKLHPTAAAMTLFEKTNVRQWRIMWYLQRLQLHNCTVCQLVFECVASAQIYLCYRARGIIVGPHLSSRASSALCIGVLYVSAADAQLWVLRPAPPHPVAGGHHPHCKRPRGPPPAHFPSDPAFVPRGLVVGAVAC